MMTAQELLERLADELKKEQQEQAAVTGWQVAHAVQLVRDAILRTLLADLEQTMTDPDSAAKGQKARREKKRK